MPSSDLRWPLADAPSPQLVLFDDLGVRRVGRGEYRGLEFLEVRAKTIINTIPPGPLPFRHTINAYRGCSHACAYCFARPTHEYLGLDSGTDFETKIVVKINAVERVRAETDPTVWRGDAIAMGTNTDPYQPAEGRYRLTRGIIEVLVERRNTFSLLTKSPLVLRDLDLLADAASAGVDVRVDLSVPTLDEAAWKATEPGTPHPRKRIDAVAELRRRGIASGVLIGPVLPGISDRPEQLEAVVAAALDAGADSVTPIALHLKTGVKEHYTAWLAEHRPDLLELHHNRYRGRAYAPSGVRRLLQRRIRNLVDRLAAADHPARTRSRPSAPRTEPPRPPTQQSLELDPR